MQNQHSRENVRTKLEQEETYAKKISNKTESILESKFRREMFLLFRYLDEEQSGTISYDDIKEAVMANIVPSNRQVNSVDSATLIWNHLDKECKGQITYPEFLESCQICRAGKHTTTLDNKTLNFIIL